jgi:hypothetical protein
VATAYQKLVYYDPDAYRRALRKLAVLAKRTPQKAVENWKLAVWGTDRNKILRAAIIDIQNTHSDCLAQAFARWKLTDLRKVKDGEIRQLEKSARITEGTGMLNDLANRHNRKALRSVRKKKDHSLRIDDAMRKVLFIGKSNARRAFDKWMAASELHG